MTYEPGDALGFVCPNAANEVQWLLERYVCGCEGEGVE